MTMSQNCRVHGPKVLGPRTLGPQGAFFRLDPKGGHSRVKKHFAISVVMAGSSFDMIIEFTWTSLRCDRSSEVLPSKNHNPGGRPYRGACGALLPGRGGGGGAPLSARPVPLISTFTSFLKSHATVCISSKKKNLGRSQISGRVETVRSRLRLPPVHF